MTNLTVITPPAEEAVSLSQAKQFLRIGHDGEDSRLADLIAGARARIERAADLALVTRQLRRTWSKWPWGLDRGRVRLGPGPVTALLAVTVYDASSVASDRTTDFRLEQGRLCLQPWHTLPHVATGGRIEVDFEAGFGPASAVPDDLREAVLRLTAETYRIGGPEGGDVGLPDAVRSILAARREMRL